MTGLTNVELNGRRAKVLGWDSTNSRYELRIDGKTETRLINPKNIISEDGVGAAAQSEESNKAEEAEVRGEETVAKQKAVAEAKANAEAETNRQRREQEEATANQKAEGKKGKEREVAQNLLKRFKSQVV